jgi:hypothetical protein
LKIDLNDWVSSPQELKSLLMGVRSYAHWYAQTTVKMKVTKDMSQTAPAVSQAVTDLLNTWFSQTPPSQTGLDELLALLQKFESTAPRITITLAAAAPESLKKQLTNWCRQNIDPNLLVDYRFSSTILGGMVIRHRSHVYDWSFKRQIMANRANFPEVLRRV